MEFGSYIKYIPEINYFTLSFISLTLLSVIIIKFLIDYYIRKKKQFDIFLNAQNFINKRNNKIHKCLERDIKSINNKVD